MAVFVLPGAALDELTSLDRPALAGIARGAATGWIAGSGPISPPAIPATILPTPLRRDPARPFGVTTDWAAIRSEATAALASSEFLWIDPGELERAEQYAGLCLPWKAREHRRAALRGGDHLLAALIHEPRFRDVWIVAPAISPGPGLAPVFWWRRGSNPGLLRSGSTHLAGVVTGADVTATLSGLVGAPYQGDGRPVTMVPEVRVRGVSAAGLRTRSDPVRELQRLGALADQTDRIRSWANRIIQVLLLALLTVGIVALRTGRQLPPAMVRAPLLLPALLLAEGAWRSGSRSVAVTTLLVIGLGLILGRARSRRGTGRSRWRAAPPVAGWAPLAAATSVSCALALVAGCSLRWTILSYSIRLGARFYGIGNEFMGWWVGAALLSLGVPTPPRVRPWAMGVLLVVAILIGHPSLGAKVGGAITALAAVGVEAWPALRRRPAVIAMALGLGGAALLGATAWDALQSTGAQTHLGHLAVRVAREGSAPLLSMISRKLFTEIRVSLGLWGLLLAAGLWLIFEARRRFPGAMATRAVTRLVPVAAVALIVNDSGVIAASLMLSSSVLAARESDVGERESNAAQVRPH